MASIDTGKGPVRPLSELATSLESCVGCSLGATRTRLVFGAGNPDADLMFVGEAPGFHEDQKGEPFVGRAGMLLTELLAGIGLERNDVYIANVLKCRPPNNRDPLLDEIAACEPNLHQQIGSIRPRVICTLGRFATRLLGGTEAGISSVRGRAKRTEIAGVSLIVFPVFHPAAALYTPRNKELLAGDFRRLRRVLDLGSKALKGAADLEMSPPPEEPEGQSKTAPETEPAVPCEGLQLPLW